MMNAMPNGRGWATTVGTLPKFDVWAVGCIAFCLANGAPPFCAVTLRQLVESINRGLQHRRASSAEARRFTEYLMNPDPKTRPTAAEALADPYVTHDFTAVRTEIHVDAAKNRCEMLGDLPPAIAAAVLRDASA
jgi:serine/threonine protein kinase